MPTPFEFNLRPAHARRVRRVPATPPLGRVAAHVPPRDVTHIYAALYVGSRPPPGDYSDQFDVIYTVAEEIELDPRLFPHVRVRKYGFHDDASGMSRRQIDQAQRAAMHVVHDLSVGRRVLVTCQMGRNRSAFVCALAVHYLTGEAGLRIARMIRQKRIDPEGVRALENPVFVGVLANL